MAYGVVSVPPWSGGRCCFVCAAACLLLVSVTASGWWVLVLPAMLQVYVFFPILVCGGSIARVIFFEWPTLSEIPPSGRMTSHAHDHSVKPSLVIGRFMFQSHVNLFDHVELWVALAVSWLSMFGCQCLVELMITLNISLSASELVVGWQYDRTWAHKALKKRPGNHNYLELATSREQHYSVRHCSTTIAQMGAL